MAKETQQEAPKPPEAIRFAVAISKGADGKWLIEDLRLVGKTVAESSTLTVLDGSKGVRVLAGTFGLMVDDRLQEWQREGFFK